MKSSAAPILARIDLLVDLNIGDKVTYAADPHKTETQPATVVALDDQDPSDEEASSSMAKVRLEDGSEVWAFGEQISKNA